MNIKIISWSALIFFGTITTPCWSKPDLSISMFSPPMLITKGGNIFYVNAIIQNAGDTIAPQSVARYYISSAPILDLKNARVAGESVIPALPPGTSIDIRQNIFRIPQGLPDGTFFLAACLDPGSAITETDESNNCSFSTTSEQQPFIIPTKILSGFPPVLSETKCYPASEPCVAKPAPIWWQCGWDSPEEAPAITKEQEQRLTKFAFGIFSPALTDVQTPRIPRETLLTILGTPISTSVTEKDPYDPTTPKEIVTIWEYSGFSITTVASKPKPDQLFVEMGTVTGTHVPLLFGLYIGQPIDQWTQQFGKPVCNRQQSSDNKEFSLLYDNTISVPCKIGTCVASYRIELLLDDSGKVKRLHWSYPML